MSEPITEPGIYQNLSFEDYRAIPALSQSVLKIIGSATPKHARAAFRGEMDRDDTKSLQLGRLEHLWIVEGEEEFRKRTVIAPTYCEGVVKSKGGIRCYNTPIVTDGEKWFCGTHGKGLSAPEGEFCTDAQVSRIKAMADAVRSHDVQRHLSRPGWSECTIIWDVPVKVGYRTCPKCGCFEHPRTFNYKGRLWCWRCREYFEIPRVAGETVHLRHKARLDRLADPHEGKPHTIIDLKRMQLMTGSREKREKTILNYGWQIQCAMYCEAVRAHFGVDRVRYNWIFIEEKRPHDVAWIPASEETIRIGTDQLQRMRKTWAICQLTDIWPGVCVGNQEPGGLPTWFVRQYLRDHGDSFGALQTDDPHLFQGSDDEHGVEAA